MDEYEKLLTELAGLAGIVPEYYDIFGKKHAVSLGSRIALLEAMGLHAGTTEELRLEIDKKRNRVWLDVIDPVTVISVHAQPHFLAVHLPLPEGKEHAARIALIIRDEQGKEEEIYFSAETLQIDGTNLIGGRRFVRFLLSLPEKETGYYLISLACSHPEPVFDNNAFSLEKAASMIITPESCYLPEQLQSGKIWGVGLNLYALRSERNWGAGDFGDLETLVTWLSGLKAGFVGINPLHEIPNTVPFGISPYSPVSRLYRSHLYIDMERVPEVAALPRSAALAERIAALKKSEQVDYEGVAGLKQEVLEQSFEIFWSNHYHTDSFRGREFREYVRTEGAPLEMHALFLALCEYMRRRHKPCAWPEWPEEYRSPASPAVNVFRKNNEKRLLFFMFLQWIIDTQMEEVSAAASAANMAMGVYGDLAIGAVDTGSDGWMYQDVLAEQVTVGAPPDDFNANGQDWGFPPMIPEKLKESGYDLFIRTIRKNMQHLGALRIDHAPGLFRLFWIPKGKRPGDGAYVRTNAGDLLKIIALESMRSKTAVIGEDLGTITDEMRHALHRYGILSYRLLYFERNYPDPSFVPPDRYPALALAAVTSHDLPTLYGFWSGRDLEMKRKLGIISEDEQYEQQKRDRDRDRNLMLNALQKEGILPAPLNGDGANIPAMTFDLCRAVYRFLFAAPSKLVLVSLDDVIGTLDQQNMPGTVSEYPNWMQKARLSLEEIIADPGWQQLAGIFRTTR